MFNPDHSARRPMALSNALAAGALSLMAMASAVPAALAADKEVTVNVTNIKAVDKADELSKGDFYARVTIDGDIESTQPIKQDNETKPEWKISKKVSSTSVDVRLELLDKDVSQDDEIDINRLPNKRSLDFSVNTKTCSISGFATGYKCGATISRTGDEKKSAEIEFNVTVSK